MLPSLRAKGVPAVTTTDGPSGIRLSACCSLIPIGTLLACSFDDELVEGVYTAVSGEMAEKGSDVLLAPGINIHRSPLCGRNFEYYSEDPLLCGKIAAAAVRGIQHNNRSACPKHFACNNQETRRNTNDSRVSQRALREIYLRCFEIVVKEANPNVIMTSYNKVNGVYFPNSHCLCTKVLRNEWGFDGFVITDASIDLTGDGYLDPVLAVYARNSGILTMLYVISAPQTILSLKLAYRKDPIGMGKAMRHCVYDICRMKMETNAFNAE